jgi:hypothetical protein
MPSTRRRSRRNLLPPLAVGTRRHLLFGEWPCRWDLPAGDDWVEVYTLTEQELRQMWKDHRDELLAEWDKTDHGPDERPWAQIEFEDSSDE